MGKRSGCAINHALEIFGDRWSLLIVRDMAQKGHTAFSQFRTMSEGIASNILSDRLARLEAAGVISRQPDAQDGRRTRYLLTESGRDLIPVLLDIMAWSFRHDPSVNVSPAMAARIARDRDGLAAEIRAKLDGQ